MTAYFSLLLILAGILFGAALWSVILKIRRFEKIARLLLLIGPMFLIGMSIYWISVVKDVVYSRFVIIFLAILHSALFVLVGILIVGVIIILAVGGYWCVVNFRKTDFKVFWQGVRNDFISDWKKIKAWIEGEE